MKNSFNCFPLHQELNEVFLVSLSHTVVDPGAVMIHSPDAVFAYSTMVSSGGSVHLTSEQLIN